MRSNIPFISHRMGLNLDESGSSILLSWQDLSAVTVDPVTQSQLGTPVARTETLRGFVHYVQAATVSQVRQFAEIEPGDCLVDLPPDVTIDGRTGLTFTIDGVVWYPKNIGNKLAKSWDVLAHGERLYRTVLLRK